MTLRLNGSTSGYTEIDAPAVAGSNTLVLPTGNGSAGNILGTDGSGNLSWVNGRMVLETAKTATSTAVDFTGIPSWVKKITVMFNGVSLASTNNLLIQLGTSSGLEQTSYVSSGGQMTAGGTSTVYNGSKGFVITSPSAASLISAVVTICFVSGNTWVSGHYGADGNSRALAGGGTKTLSGTLDRIRITNVVGTDGTVGTDTFDAGSINILYEG
jgi:hypothetical protein